MYEKSSSAGVLICAICQKTVLLEVAKTDEDGNAVHENCYLSKLGLMRPLRDRLQSLREGRLPGRQKQRPER